MELPTAIGIPSKFISTTGAPGMGELEAGVKAFANGEAVTNEVFAHPLPFNVIPHIDKFQDNGYTKEEMKANTCTLYQPAAHSGPSPTAPAHSARVCR